MKFDKKYQSIYSALIQIRDNERIITNPNEENNMEKEEIKNFFEKHNYFKTLLNNNEPIKDSFNKLNKFYELLENAQKVILDKKVELVSDDINYSLKVSDFIKNIQTNKGGDYMKGAVFYDKEIIENMFYNGNHSSQNIFIPIIENWGLSIVLDQIIDFHLCISVYSINNNIINKLREEPLKNEIGNILNKGIDKYEEDADKYYIYSRFVDIEKDKPEEIGQKIIDLYNLLKEKITQ